MAQRLTPASAEPGASPAWMLAALFLLLALLLGGGTRQALLADAALQLLALPLLVYALLRLLDVALDRLTRAALWCTGLTLMWLLLQLVPIAPSLWDQLPGRALLSAELKAAGVTPIWRPISVDTLASVRALLAWLPPLALALFVLGLDAVGRLRVLQVIVALTGLSLLLGMAQLAGGEHSPLRWHAITNTTQAVGPFANRNHLASLLVLAIPLAVAQLVGFARRAAHSETSTRRGAKIALAVLAVVLFLIGLAVTRSRAGVVLAGVAVLLSGALVWRRANTGEHPANHHQARRWLALAGVAGLVFAIQYGFVGLLARFENEGFDDARWHMAATTATAARAFAPVGVGVGNFGAVYPSFEPTSQRGIYYVNRAHSDWIEWWLGGGVPLIFFALVGVALLFAATLAIWRGDSHLRLPRLSAALGCWLVLLHSALDYPLRTAAIACVFAAMLAVAFAADTPFASHRPRRHRSRDNIAKMPKALPS